jgi:murein DD-endopeptidase MepM/ murein hydrolase activator NlpD
MLQHHSKTYLVRGLVLMVAFSFFTFLISKNGGDFMASIIPTKHAAPYDGLVTPIQKVPNWIALKSDQWKLDYNQIPADKLVPLPVYDPNQLKMPSAQLSWTKETDKAIRNAKVTYSTPYMGNYKLDGVEYGGSHLAIDIKIPSNTPIYAIGNGVVVKVSFQASGFGNHVVIKHENFPSLNDPNVKTTYYSSYNHLNNAIVNEGDIVTKGQQVGLSGSTGVSSTPHLHFQIDNDQAPWHPYWPFNYQEANEAGLNFVTAINEGLGKEKAIATTINPMLYVQKYLNGSQTTTTPVPPVQSEEQKPTSTTPAVTALPVLHSTNSIEPAENAVTEPATETKSDPSPAPAEESSTQKEAVTLEVETDGSFVVGKDEIIRIKALDENGKIVSGYQPAEGVSLMVSLGGATLKKTYLNSKDFAQGVAQVVAIPNTEKGLRIKALESRISGESEIMENAPFSDISKENKSRPAIEFLKKHNVIGGYNDGSFKPNNTVLRGEALKFLYESMQRLEKSSLENTRQTKLPFRDVQSNVWYTDYVKRAYEEGIVSGYSDGTFKPGSKVRNSEFLKMLLKMSALNCPEEKTAADDSKRTEMQFECAKKANLIDSETSFEPGKEMTREQVAEMIYRMLIIKLGDQQKYNAGFNPDPARIKTHFGEQ